MTEHKKTLDEIFGAIPSSAEQSQDTVTNVVTPADQTARKRSLDEIFGPAPNNIEQPKEEESAVDLGPLSVAKDIPSIPSNPFDLSAEEYSRIKNYTGGAYPGINLPLYKASNPNFKELPVEEQQAWQELNNAEQEVIKKESAEYKTEHTPRYADVERLREVFTPEMKELLGHKAANNISSRMANVDLNTPLGELYYNIHANIIKEKEHIQTTLSGFRQDLEDELNMLKATMSPQDFQRYKEQATSQFNMHANQEESAENLYTKVMRDIANQDDIQSLYVKAIEAAADNNQELQSAQKAYGEKIASLIPQDGEKAVSDEETQKILASLTPEERAQAEEEIARITQEVEAATNELLKVSENNYKKIENKISNDIHDLVVGDIVDIYTPRSKGDYIFERVKENSLLGMGFRALMPESEFNQYIKSRALENYGASTMTDIGAGVLALLVDTPALIATGGVGGAAATGARGFATRIVASNIARREAMKGVSKTAIKEVAKRKVASSAINTLGTAALAQAITLGGYDAAKATMQEVVSPTGANGTINWDNVLHRFEEGAVVGAVVGGLGAGTQLGKSAMYRSRPDMAYTFAGKAADLGIDVASFAAENAAFLGVGSLMSGEPITIESVVESVGTLGILKGIGVVKRVAKGEKLFQQPNWQQSVLSDLNFTKEELNAMRQAGVDMSQVELIQGALLEANEAPTVDAHNLTSTYNFVMESKAIPTTAKMKLRYLVTGELPRVYGPSGYEIVELEGSDGVVEVRTTDYMGRLVQIKGFGSVEAAKNYAARLEPVLEKNTIVDAATAIAGADRIMAIDKAIDAYMESSAYAETGGMASKTELMSEMLIALGLREGTLPEGATARVETINGLANNFSKDINTVNDIKLNVLKQQGATKQELDRAINIKPDLRTVKEANLVKAYVEALKAVKESATRPTGAEQAQYNAPIQKQIEQGSQEIADAKRETQAVRESLDVAAKKMAMDNGRQIAIVRLSSGEEVAVHNGNIVTKADGTIDVEASEPTIIVKSVDSEGNEVRNMVSIEDIAEVVEQSATSDAVNASMSVIEAQAVKKRTLDKALADNEGQGVPVTTIDGSTGVIVGVNEVGDYILRFKGTNGQDLDLPVSINDIAEVATEAPMPETIEQAAIQDAEQNVTAAVQQAENNAKAAEEVVTYDYDFPPITEADLAPIIDFDKIQWDKLTPQEYADVSAMAMGNATTLSSSHTYYINSRNKLQKAQERVAEQQKVVDRLNGRFGLLSSPAEAQKLRKEIAKAEQEKAKREQAVQAISEQMEKYAFAMKKYGVDVTVDNDLIAERAKLEEERTALLEADKEFDRYESEAEKNEKKTIANTPANRKYVEQVYAERFGVSPAQAGISQAILWDLANGAIKLRWDNTKTDSGAVQRGLMAELGVHGAEERRAYKAVIDNKNGQSVDAYVHDLWQSGEWADKMTTEEAKDELLGILQSVPNGSAALKELLDMSGAKADFQAEISLGKGDIVRRLEEVDAKIAANEQARADFRKRINDTVQKLENGEPIILPVGEGEFGPIYDQFRGKPQEAIEFLLSQKNGEAIGALNHKDIGEIDLVWGKEGTGHSDGYGLSKLAKYHPEVLDKLQPILDDMEVVSRNANRVNLESPKYQAAVRLTWNNERKNWLLTAFEKRNSAIDNTTDTGETALSGRQNDTATLQSTVSENKDTTSIPENQISEKETATEYQKELLKNARSLVEEKYGFEMARLPKMLEQAFADGNQGEIKRLQNIFSEYVSLFGADAAPIMDVTLRQMKSAVGTEKYKERKNKEKSKTPAHQAYDSLIRTVQNWLKNNTPANEDIPFMIEQKPAEKTVSEEEQSFDREVFDAFAGHLGETLGAESVVTDAAEAKRVLEWHQAVGGNLRTAVREDAEIVAERAEIERIAKENGTWLKAPNGKDTNLNPRQWVDVRTSRFKAWFGDWENDLENASKVVDENGEPMVMYHGSSWKPLLEADGKAEFKMQEGALGKGAYFAREVAEAASYAKDALGNWNLSDADVDEGGYITEAFLNIRNEDQILRDDEYGGGLPVAYIAVAISPNQIKSATENTGEYSADNADIRYWKRPNGEVYGFVYEGKVYLDPTNIDPKSPVHEYTELWCSELAKANKELWERGKELVKQTKVWEEVNADENYKNQSEDLRASEAWSRIVADEMMGKAREYGSKGLMAKLRGWLRSFWKAVKSVVEKWTKKDLEDLTVDQFKKMTMADFINKVDPRKWNAKKPKEVSKSLVGIHNISQDKLQKALKQGGLANPSAAVIDIAKSDHFDYGEYSFIMPKSLVDKKSGRNIGTFDRDAWTPLYPAVEYSHSKESKNNLNKLVEGLDEGLADKIKRETLAKVNGNGFYSGLQVVFLKERGVEVPIASKTGKFFGTIEEFKQLFGDKEPTYENYQALDKAQKDEVTLWIRAKGMPEEIARYKELLVKPARKEGLWNFLLDDVGYGKFDQAVYGLQADARNAGTPDYEKTIDNAVNYIRENGLQEEFDAWQAETFNNLGFDERIQVGWSPSGERIMRKNTLENVSKYMRRQGKNASSDHWSNSEGKMLAQLSQNFSSLDKIRANKWRLRSAADDVVGIRKRINQAAQLFMNFGKNTDLFMEEQSALAYLEDILVGGMNPDKVVEEFNKVTKRNVTLTEEQKTELKQLREDMKNLPVQYFETKFERPVMFNEFAAVVAPDTMPEAIEKQLREAGLNIYKYNPDVEGDRRKATLAATASEDIRFMIVGEKGAAELDKAEEATIRLDNLAVAREMEAEYLVEKVNARFNEELQRQIDGTLPKGHIYKMGMPSDILLACGFPDMPIELSATRLAEKSAQDNHIFDVADVKDLVKEINTPWAVFKYGGNAKNLIIGIEHNGKQFLVGVHFNQLYRGMEVSDIRGIFPKDNAEWLNWIAQGKADYLDKEKIQDLIDKQRINLAEVEYLDLDLVTKLIQDFENPTIKPQNVAKKIKLATGWERGADGKWRYEIQDFKLKPYNPLTKNKDGQIVVTLEDVIDDEALFAAYPALRTLSVLSLPNQEWEGYYQDGSIMPHIALGNKLFTPATERLIELNKELDSDIPFDEEETLLNEIEIERKNANNAPAFYVLDSSLAKSVLLHEVQHAIQHIEGFAQGGAPELRKPDTKEGKRLREIVREAISFVEFYKNEDIATVIRDSKKYGSPQWESMGKESQDILLEYLGNKRKVKYEDIRKYLSNAFDMTLPREYGEKGYRRFAGEVEARNVQARMGMTPDQRRATLLAETEDVAREDQIFLESNLGVAHSVEVSEKVEAPTRKPRKTKEEKLSEKIEELKTRLNDKKKSLDNVLADIYNFLTATDVTETMGAGVGRKQYRSAIRNAVEAIKKAYEVTDPIEARKIVDKYLSDIDDNLSQLLSRQRLLEVTEILDAAIYGYTAEGVRTGKRIDEHTREVFNIIRNAIGEPFEEERTEEGRRKPVRYRLKNRTEDGDIATSFRLKTKNAEDESIIQRLRNQADEIISDAEENDAKAAIKASQLEYAANVLESYDRALALNEAIGKTTEDIAEIDARIAETYDKYRNAPIGSTVRKELYELLKQLRLDKTSEQMNRANLRHRYAAVLKTFTTTLEQLEKKGVMEFASEALAKAEAAVKWRRGIYNSVKNPKAPVLPVENKNAQGKNTKVNWRGLNTRAKINESVFMATFAEMSRDIDINSIPGQWRTDGWYYQFMLAPEGYMARTDWRFKQEKTLHQELNDAILRIVGKHTTKEALKALSKDPFNVLSLAVQKKSGVVIDRIAVGKNKEGKVVGGYQENVPLSIGELLYIRNTVRQPNGMAGYLSWGVSEKAIQEAVLYAEGHYPELCRFADWVVGEFMPKLYDMQDAIYFKKFGTHLPQTAFYFPFVRDKRMVGKIAEVGEGEVSLPSSVTGNIVERVKTSAKIDLSADMFKVLHDHIKETLDWCAYVELTDKFNSVATSHAFDNILKAQGVSREKLKEVYQIAVGQGKINSTDNTTLTKTLNALSRGIVSSKIAFNLNSAAKQLVSGTCALGYTSNPKIIAIWANNFFTPAAIRTGVAKSIQMLRGGELNPIEAINWVKFNANWKWAIENVPTLQQRWEGRTAGFDMLKLHSFDTWDKFTSLVTTFGLTPNAAIDLFTCANVARTVYDYEYPRLLKRGRSKEEAHREACVKAAVFVNETQQSGIDGFMSSFQSSRGLTKFLGVGLGAYQNTSMAFARNERFAVTNMLRMLNPSTMTRLIDNQVEAYKELGLEDREAAKLAKYDFAESYGQQFAGFIHNGVISNLLWTLAGTVLSTVIAAGITALFSGKDEAEKALKNEEFRDAISNTLSIETIIAQCPILYNTPISKQIMTYMQNAHAGTNYGGVFESPVDADIQMLIDELFKQVVGVKNENTEESETKEPADYSKSISWIIFDKLVSAGIGVSPDLLARMTEGVAGAIRDDKVEAEDVMRVLSSPRGLTRAIAGEVKEGESLEEYLDRLSYIYRQVNAGSGQYDERFVAKRTKEYIEKMDNKLYDELGINPREVRQLEARVKAIAKGLSIKDTNTRKGVEKIQAMPEAQRELEGRVNALIGVVNTFNNILSKKDFDEKLIISFDEEDTSKRKELLKRKYDKLKEIVDMWNNNK